MIVLRHPIPTHKITTVTTAVLSCQLPTHKQDSFIISRQAAQQLKGEHSDKQESGATEGCLSLVFEKPAANY